MPNTKIGLVDADLLGRKNHRFPNLALMKISNYYKERGMKPELLNDYSNINDFERLYISKVFTDTPVPDEVYGNYDKGLNLCTGGSGFMDFNMDMPIEPLPHEIEHTRPDYNLYDNYLNVNPVKGSALDIYQKASIGFLTRGCPRHCDFCVNKNSKGVELASDLDEFLDYDRKYIVLLDDNILAYKNVKDVLNELISTGKPFTFKQGLDIRFLTEELAELIFKKAKYWGDYIFAFDDISEYELIEKRLKMIRKITSRRNIKFYVLTGFKSTDEQDIVELFERLELIKKYGCLPYVMRYQAVNDKPYLHSINKGVYVNVARWCNQPAFFRKLTFEQFCTRENETRRTTKPSSSYRAMLDFKGRHPDIAERYFNK